MKSRNVVPNLALCLVVSSVFAGMPLVLAGCESDEGPSHTKSTTKSTTEGPEGKTTTTTTHEKRTDVYPK